MLGMDANATSHLVRCKNISSPLSRYQIPEDIKAISEHCFNIQESKYLAEVCRTTMMLRV